MKRVLLGALGYALASLSEDEKTVEVSSEAIPIKVHPTPFTDLMPVVVRDTGDQVWKERHRSSRGGKNGKRARKGKKR